VGGGGGDGGAGAPPRARLGRARKGGARGAGVEEDPPQVRAGVRGHNHHHTRGAHAHPTGAPPHPAHRGRGYGRAVVSASMQHALDRGDLVVYQTLVANLPAVAIARALGCHDYARHLAVRLR